MKSKVQMLSLVCIIIVIIIMFSYITYFSPSNVQITARDTHASEYQLNHHVCKFSLPDGMQVDCATLLTPETSGSFELPVAIVRYLGVDKRKGPVFYLQGGPGANAGIDTYGIEGWQYFMDNAGLKRDLIVMDRRGVGGSKPALTCQAFDRFSEKVLQKNLSVKQEMIAGKTILEQCYKYKNFNIEHYGTQKNAEDLRALIELLNFQHWNLVSVSYGTRLALELISKNTNNVTKGLDALVLDSVYPPKVGGFNAWPEAFNLALTGFYEACNTYEPCGDAWSEAKNIFLEPTLAHAFAEVLDNLKRRPIKLTVSRFNDIPIDIVVNEARFLSAVFSASYTHEFWPDIVKALVAAKERDRIFLKKFMGDFVRQALSGSVSDLVFMAVDCQDNSIGTAAGFNSSVKSSGIYAPYLKDLWQYQICHHWPNTQMALSLDKASLEKFETPTLILAGDHDPITPKIWASKIASHLPNKKLRIFDNTGHAVLWSRSCALSELGRYLDSPKENWQACKSTVN